MNIVVTDGYTLNPGDLSWEGVAAYGDISVYERTAPEMIVKRCKDADIVLTNKVPFSKETLEALPRLKFISVLATGYNVIDVEAAKQRNVTVSNVPGYSTDSVAQHTFALLLELTNHVGRNARATAQGRWEQSEDFCFTEAPIAELSGKIFGVVGFGAIGQQAGRVAEAFGMKVIYYNPREKKTSFGEPKSLTELFTISDVVSLHCPLTEDNFGFVDHDLLELMKPTAILINTARGQLINDKDLAKALNDGRIRGAGLDVLSQEPPPGDNPLLSANNCIITPHTAWMSKEARERVMNTTVANIAGFLKQQPVNVVN